MRFLLVAVVSFATLSFQAQNWNLVQSGSQLNYRLDTAEVISQTVSIKEIEVVEGDSILHLNRVVEDCPDCTTNGSEFPCWNEGFVVLDRPSILGFEIHETDSGFLMMDENTWFFPHNLQSTDVWQLTDDLTAQVDYVSNAATFSTADTVRHISLDNGETMIWSKKYGLLEFPDWTSDQQWVMTGVKGPNLGEHLPGFEGVFHWEVGDAFYFEGGNWSSSYNHTLKKRREVVSAEFYSDSVVYEIKDAWSAHHDAQSQSDQDWNQDGIAYYSETYHFSDWNVLNLDANELMTGDDYLPDFEGYEGWWFSSYVEIGDADILTAYRPSLSAGRYVMNEGAPSWQEGSFFDEWASWQSISNWESFAMGQSGGTYAPIESDTLCQLEDLPGGDFRRLSLGGGAWDRIMCIW